MTAEYNAFSRPAFTAADFERADAETVSDSPLFAQPIVGGETRAARGGMPPVAWMAVPVIALALAGGVYALNRPAPAATGVAQLTPGQPTLAAPMEAAPVQTARTEPGPVTPTPNRMAPEAAKAPIRTAEASPRVSAKVAPPRHAATRAAPSAAETGQNASAVIPATQAPAQPPAPVVIAAPAPVVTAAPETAPQAPAPQPDAPTPPNS